MSWYLEKLRSCGLCPRKCGTDRTAGERGFCGAGANARIARAALHFWEEPCISGEKGSGAVFFSGCTMRCIFCQNYEVSTNNLGTDITVPELAETFLELERQGAENINLVTPTQYAPQIISALGEARQSGLSVPAVYNTGGYESEDTLGLLEGYIDIYMPDLKYWSVRPALSYSSAPDYTETARRAIDAMYEQTGEPVFDERGMMKRGVIVRHMMLPGMLADTIHIIDHIHKRFGDRVYFSLMSQYTPVRHIEKYPGLNRRVDQKYYRFAVEHCMELGMNNVFIQEGESAEESFIPEFSGTYERTL